MAFEDTLNVLFKKMSLGIIIPKWSKDKGYDFEKFFKIKTLDKNKHFIEIGLSTNITDDRTISIENLEKTYEKWSSYREGKTNYNDLGYRDSYQKSFIISILKWLEGEISITSLP
jgi:hypothetical protein